MAKQLFTIEELAEKFEKKVYQVRYIISSNDVQPKDPTTRPLRYDMEDYLRVIGEGKKTVVEELQKLGTHTHPKLGLKIGEMVTYKFLTDNYWGFSSGISYTTREPDDTLVITKIDSKEKKQYEDFYDVEAGVLKYFGEGQNGDMSLDSKGNRRLFNHIKTKKAVDVYQKKAVKQYIFLGRFTVTNVSALKAPDIKNNNRLAYIFSMKPLSVKPTTLTNSKGEDLSKLADPYERLKDIQNTVSGDNESGKVKRKVTTGYKRSRQLVEVFKEWYEYRCQLCNPINPLPRIEMKNDRYYVEVHHCTGLAEAMNIPPGGNQDEGDFLVDHYHNLVSTCSHHHMLLHHYKFKFTYNNHRKAFIAEDGNELPIYILHKEHHIGNK